MSYLGGVFGIYFAPPGAKIWEFLAISAVFAILGRLMRGVTNGGALVGAIICFLLLWGGGVAGFVALLTVFLMTWASTRVGYAQKLRLGTAETRSGRNVLQVIANLGVAAACAAFYARFPQPKILAVMGAALAEAAADTVSSEIGQALGGSPRLITTWQKVAQGTDGAITWMGTAAGILAASAVALVFFLFGNVGRVSSTVVGVAGVAGTITDSLLGASLERRGRLGNNAVNFISTVVAAGFAFLIAP